MYVNVSGPSYETRAEIGMMRVVGGDAVGMSTAFEVLEAAHAGMQVSHWAHHPHPWRHHARAYGA